jgi:hypothetical protein
MIDFVHPFIKKKFPAAKGASNSIVEFYRDPRLMPERGI